MNYLDILKIVSISATIFGVLFAFFSKVIIEKLKIYWKAESSKELARITSNLDLNNSSLSSIYANYLYLWQNSHSRKVKAVDKAWIATLNVFKDIPAPIPLILSVLTDSEINNLMIGKTTPNEMPFVQMIKDMRAEKDAQFATKYINEIDKLRPFLSEEAYTLLRGYFSIIGRVVYKFIENFQKGNLLGWKDDHATRDLLQKLLTDKEIKYIMNKDFGSFVDMKNLFEFKILNKLKDILTGHNADIDTIEQVIKLKYLYEFELQRKKEELGK